MTMADRKDDDVVSGRPGCEHAVAAGKATGTDMVA